ncbi:hypothetical protein ACFL42_00940 [Candidatus Omnitrophota bacterium]
MRIKNRFLTILLFAVIWLALIAGSIKRIGAINTLKNAIKPALNYIYTPETVVLCNFERSKDFWSWGPQGSFIERSSRHVTSGENSARITITSSEKTNINTPGIVLEDYNIGPKGEKDWSRFNSLKFDIFNPDAEVLRLILKIKDRAGRSVQRFYKIQSGKNEIITDLQDIGMTVDLRNVIYIKLFLGYPKEDRVLYLDNLRLDRDDMEDRNILSQPKIEFIGYEAPDKANPGESINFSFKLLAKEPLRKDYRVFIHISHDSELKKRPSNRIWFINADREPWTNTSRWAQDTEYEIGPIEIFFPKDFPLGTYKLQCGLFNTERGSMGSYGKTRSNHGAVDFRTSFPRLRYSNREIKDYIISQIEIID